MYITVTETIFIREFENCGRGNSFSYDGFVALFDYLEQYDDFELDVIAIDCQYVEVDQEEYDKNYDGCTIIQKLDNDMLLVDVES
jgi:hypothetical protein